MKNIKNELQNIIRGVESTGQTSKLKKTQSFLRANAGTSFSAKKQQWIKSEETTALIAFAEQENIFYGSAIFEELFVGEGAEQKVYRIDGAHVIKTNAGVFYEYWFDYFNSLLIHNYFFPDTAYTFLGFKEIDEELNAVVLQEFIEASGPKDLSIVKGLLEYNIFHNKRNNDYFNSELGIILEDLHDENVIFKDGVPFFIDTVFYLTQDFYTA
jgi:hypothetical protein